MDFASLIGIVSGVALIIISLLMGGSIKSFVDYPSMMIVFGGVAAATLLTFRFTDVVAAFKAAWFIFQEKKQDPNDTVATMTRLNDISRKHGLLAVNQIRSRTPFLKKMCNLLADGAELELLRRTMDIEIQALKHRHSTAQDVFKKMGTYAPAFGMLGTIIGLVQMLSGMSNPSTIGPAMAVALVTTFYGSFFSTLICLPVAAKLRSRTQDEIVNLWIIHEGVCSIYNGDDTYMIYEKLSSHIPTRQRRPIARSIPTKLGE